MNFSSWHGPPLWRVFGREERRGWGPGSAHTLPLGDGAEAGLGQVAKAKNQCARGSAILSQCVCVGVPKGPWVCRPQLDSHSVCDAPVEFLRFFNGFSHSCYRFATHPPRLSLLGDFKERGWEPRQGGGLGHSSAACRAIPPFISTSCRDCGPALQFLVC